MYCDFINLNEVSPIVREAVEDIQMIMTNHWDDNERMESERMLKLFENSDALLADVMSLNRKNDKTVLLLQMAVYRFCTVHFKEILGRIENGEVDGWNFIVNREIENKLKDWEVEFWSSRDNTGLIFGVFSFHFCISEIRRNLRNQPLKPTTELGYYRIEEAIKSALEDEETIKKVEELREKYAPFVLKSEKMNTAVTEKVVGELDAIQNIKKIAEIMERNLQGKLTPGDALELEKSIPEWNQNMQKLESIFSEML